MRMNRDRIIQVPHGVLLGGLCDLPQRAVDKEVESQQENERQSEDHCQSNVNRTHQKRTLLLDVRNRMMDQQISLC